MALRIETCMARHIGDRAEQQDRVDLFAHPTRPGMLMAVLADGMGGHSGGSMAAEQLLVKARQNLEVYAPAQETPRHLLEEIIHDAHVVVKLTRYTSEKEPHTTAVVFLLQAGRADWAHCGDSRLYHFRGQQTVSRTRDHSLVGELLRKGRISPAAAETHPQRHVLVSCLGSAVAPRVDHGGVDRLAAGDAFLLCSDGLWSHFSDGELAALIARQSARQAAEELVSVARARACGYGDNLSLAIVKLVDAQLA
jgi:serine/threonine protein phosphatase PrpC